MGSGSDVVSFSTAGNMAPEGVGELARDPMLTRSEANVLAVYNVASRSCSVGSARLTSAH